MIVKKGELRFMSNMDCQSFKNHACKYAAIRVNLNESSDD